MSFQTIHFAIFLCMMLGIVAVTKNEKIRQYELLFASLVFYGVWDVRFLAILLACILIVYVFGRMILRQKALEKKVKGTLIISIACLLLILGIFKYLGFFVQSLDRLFGIQAEGTISIILPIGISFYVFSCIGYLIDLYRGEIEMEVPLYREALYISFFPKVLQGPFHKAEDFYRQLEQEHPITVANISAGIQIFLFGLIKKVVIADRLGLFVNTVHQNPSIYSGATLLLVAMTYPIQLYCDFSGYSDMAVGAARMFGYDLARNFNLPFLSCNVNEYWRRWHMSLNEWFKDYLFYPIIRSGWVNQIRKSTKRHSAKFSKIVAPFVGLVVVWPLIGLWHGASFHYVLHGCLYGILMIISLLGDTYGKKKEEKYNVLRIVRTWFVTVFALLLFRSDDLSALGMILKGIFTWQRGISYIYTWSLIYIPLVFLACIYAYRTNEGEGYYIQMDLGKLSSKIAFCTVALLAFIFMYVGENYFIYFQF